MNGWISEAWRGVGAAGQSRPGRRRATLHFLTDLAVSIGIVFIAGWLFFASAGDATLRDAAIAQNQVYVEIGWFTPQKLFFSYIATMGDLNRSMSYAGGISDGIAPAVGEVVTTVGRLVLDLVLAPPLTLIDLYRQTSGLAAAFVLAGFGMTVGVIITWLLLTRASPWLLVLALVLSPVAVSIVFLLMQVVTTLLLEAAFWFGMLAPYAIACPVLCALYWVAFPGADRGATHAVAHAIGLVFVPRRG